MKKSRQRRGNIRFFSQSLGIVLWRTGKTKAEQHKFSEEKWAKLFRNEEMEYNKIMSKSR